MRRAKILVDNIEAGELTEVEFMKKYRFDYSDSYTGMPVSMTMPLDRKNFEFDGFPPFFDGLLPEGFQLEGLLKTGKIDRNDLFSQLVAVGMDMVGNITVKEVSE